MIDPVTVGIFGLIATGVSALATFLAVILSGAFKRRPSNDQNVSIDITLPDGKHATYTGPFSEEKLEEINRSLKIANS